MCPRFNSGSRHHCYIISQVKKELKRIYKAFFFSLEGIKAALKEPAFKTEVLLFLLLLPFILFTSIEPWKKALLFESLILMLVVEMVNVCVEETVNYISFKKHPLAKKIKDVASAAVLVCVVNVVLSVVWVFSS